MTRRENARNKELNALTKESLSEAAARLLHQIPLSKISVTRLCKEAGVSRNAFYRNFEEVQDVLTARIELQWQKHLIKARQKRGEEKINEGEELIRMFYEEKDYIQDLKRNGRLDIVEHTFLRFLQEKEETTDLPVYLTYMFAYACAGLVMAMCASDFKDSPETIIEMFQQVADLQARQQAHTG